MVRSLDTYSIPQAYKKRWINSPDLMTQQQFTLYLKNEVRLPNRVAFGDVGAHKLQEYLDGEWFLKINAGSVWPYNIPQQLPMRRNENDERKWRLTHEQLFMELKPADSRELYIEYEAGGPLGMSALKVVLRRVKRLASEAVRVESALQQFTDRCVIIDHGNPFGQWTIGSGLGPVRRVRPKTNTSDRHKLNSRARDGLNSKIRRIHFKCLASAVRMESRA